MMSIKEFLNNYNSSFQTHLCSNPYDCWFGHYPTLADLNRHYKAEVAQMWIIEELTDISEYVGVKDKFTSHQLDSCAAVIYMNFYFLKISELMLFFFKFKSGQYEEFYGAVDPLAIVNSLWEFVRTTREAAMRQHKEEIEQALECEREPYQMDWKQYCMAKGISGKESPLVAIVTTRSSTSPDKSDNDDSVKQAALNLLHNTLGLSEETLAKAKSSFTKYHNCTPEEYIKK